LRDNAITHRASDSTSTTVRFGIPSPADLDAYVGSGEPTAVAGGFTLDGLGGWFVDGVDGDPSSVIGIGLPLMRRLFERAGLSISVLWQANPIS
jgi:septum formation protein